MSAPAILIIHNYYRIKGGEDTVVMHETAALKSAGAEVYELYFQNPLASNSYGRLFRFFSGIYFNLSAYWKVFRMVREKNIKVVHVHNIFYQASPSVLWAARHAGARVVSTLHNFRLFCLNALFYREGRTCTLCVDQRSFKPGIKHACFRNSKKQSFFLAAALRMHFSLGSWHKAVDAFIVVNPLMETYLTGIGIGSNRIHLKPNCITDQPFTPYTERGDHYLIAGRLEREKGLPEVLEVWEQLPLPLRIAGSGSMQSEIDAKSGQYITYLGHLNATAMRQELSSCKAFIFSSKLIEGMPLSLIEAMACGAICIAQASAVTRMLIKDGERGLLFDHNDDAASLEKAIHTLENMTLAEQLKMSHAARRFYEENFSMREHLRHIAAIYEMELPLPAAPIRVEPLAEAQVVEI